MKRENIWTQYDFPRKGKKPTIPSLTEIMRDNGVLDLRATKYKEQYTASPPEPFQEFYY